MPIAVGMYLPFGLAIPILIGGMIAHLYTRKVPHDDHDRVLHRGVLFSSGVIAGEALTAVGLAGLAALGISTLNLALPPNLITACSILAAIGIVVCFVLGTKPKHVN